MKNQKKIKLEKLNFFVIDDNYIKYLSQFDKHIAYNKSEKRPYIGVVIIVEGHYYFAPLFSPKPKHRTYKDNLTFFKIISIKSKNDLGIIRFSDQNINMKVRNRYDIISRMYGIIFVVLYNNHDFL